MLELNNCASLLKKRKRVGRGGSRGGTSGRGNKGQKARTSGGVGPIFEGGQMPLTRRLPKRGFNNTRFATQWTIINLDVLEASFENGAEVTRELLVARGIIKGARKTQLKVLGNGILQKKLIVHADAFSSSAAESIRGQGGEVRITKEG
jgi:large subunit ribosomal protein L15